MKKSLKKLLRSLWLVCFGAMPLCIVGEALAGDDIAEIEAALAREAQAGPRLKAASPKLLSATDGSDTYEATGELNVTKSSGSIVLKFNVPKAYTHVNSITLSMDAYDVDYPVSNERDMVYFNGVQLGRLQGGNNIWNENTFRFTPNTASLKVGENTLRIDVNVDNGGWVTRIGWAKLVVDGVVDYIRLEASQNYDDKIHLEWKNVSSGLSGARYYIDRRGNPNDQFKCLNPDNPTPERQYKDNDRDCLPGVNYYYRVRSESGIESNEVVGKRVAKTVEPRFEFTLTGTVRPNPVGRSGEEDILVTRRLFTLGVSVEDSTQNVAIKKIELIGEPIGGAESQKYRHRKIWFSADTEITQSAQSLFTDDLGQPFPANSCIVELSAKLRAGNGLHGKYRWSVDCEYELDGKRNTCKAYHKQNFGVYFEKPVYFEKYGIDNGVKVASKYWNPRRHYVWWPLWDSRWVNGEWTNNTYCTIIPNWYTYWKEDGACPGLRGANVSYRGKYMKGASCGGEAGPLENENESYVYIDREAAESMSVYEINNPSWSGEDSYLGIRKENGEIYRVVGIYHVEDIVAHEHQHNVTRKRYNEQRNKTNPEPDSDRNTQRCAVKGGKYATCTGAGADIEKECCDRIVDVDESSNYFGKFLGGIDLGIQTNDVDTYNLRQKKHWSYGGYGDDELVSMVAGRQGMSNANWRKDWAYPGELAGGIVEYASCVHLGTRTLSATPKSSPRLQSSEPQSNTNLIITINSIAVDTQRHQNSVTGIVYTIGVSIQGDDLVDFNGYLVDAQSNVVATAISAANAESESVELFFDSRNIFDNYNCGPLTLGSVDLTIDDNYSTNNLIGTLYDFAVEPIEVNKSELLCNKGYILDGATTNDVSASGIAVSIPVLVNVAGDYRLEAELVSTNDELVATAFATNYCATGTNVFELTFTSDAIYQNGRSGIHAVRNVQLWCGDEMIDATATAFEFADSYDSADFVPSGVSIAVDSSSGRFVEPTATPDGMLSSVRFVFDVTNATDTMVGYDVASVLMNTNSEIVASIRTAVAVTNGLNQVVITVPASAIAKSGVNGPYRFESIELLPQGESSCGTTYRPSALSAAYTASDFGISAIEPCGTPRLVETPDCDRLTVEYSYEALRVGRVIAEVVLADRNGDFAARVVTTNDVSEVGVKTNSISIASDDVTGGITNSPYAVACLSLTPDIIGESPVYMDTESLTNIFWTVASPAFSPATKTVFFKKEQPVAISCVTSAAEIRYTLDGSEPTNASPLYVGAFTISSNTTVKAKAFVDGMRSSETVQAEYIHAAIVGDNLVQYTSPDTSVAQTVSVPVPGTYQVSFDWTQGGDIELRMAQNGITNSIAVIAAAVSGTTNFLYDISSAGNYELILFDLSSGISQPAEVANLNIAIPSTPENRQRFWIYETESTYCSTGEWIPDKGFVGGKMPIEFESLFLPNTVSDGGLVTIISTVECRTIELEVNADEIPESKAAISICVDETGANVFRVLTIKDDGSNVWKTVSADGREYPEAGVAYTFRTVLDLTNRTYSVAIVDGDTEFLLGDEEGSTFAFANDNRLGVEQVRVWGRCEISSLYGECDNLSLEFVRGDKVHLINGTESSCITEGQAAWLNSMGAYDVVKAKVADMDDEGLSIAYLLNLDLTKDGFGLVSFSVSGIEVTETEVRINVNLSREGAVQVQGSSGMRDAPINGILKLYGGETPQAKSLLNATIVTGESFGEGDTATFVYPRSGNAKFFRPIIDMP